MTIPDHSSLEFITQKLDQNQTATKPIVAILTIDDDLLLFRGNRKNFSDLIETGQKMGIITYVVTVKSLKLHAKKIVGFTYDAEKKTWVKAWFPRPTIIYNRIPQRVDERLPRVKKKLESFSKIPDIRLFNRRFFNKLSLFQWLNENQNTKTFIPETKKLTDCLVLNDLLKKHSLLYLKPARGKAGVGIMTVTMQPEKKLPLRLQIQEQRGSRTFRSRSLKRLWERISRQTASLNQPYIAQQGIQLISVDEHPFDLRALVQKNGNGKWEISGIGARVAGDASITTHVPRGGYIEDPKKLLIDTFGAEKAKIVLKHVKKTIHTIARQIERASHSRLCEMSMDLGIDVEGHVWFFEANSKPMKFDEPHIRNKSLERIFQYSLFLHQLDLKKQNLLFSNTTLKTTPQEMMPQAEGPGKPSATFQTAPSLIPDTADESYLSQTKPTATIKFQQKDSPSLCQKEKQNCKE